MKVVLDSNVLVSAFATRGLCADVLRLVLAEHELVTVSPIIREVTRVLARKFRIPSATVAEIAAFLTEYMAATPITRGIRITLRDPDDAIILEAAIAVGADVLVTGRPGSLGRPGRYQPADRRSARLQKSRRRHRLTNAYPGRQHAGLRRRYPNLEFVEVPYQDTTLPALFMKAPGVAGPAPTVVVFDGMDNCKEMSVLFAGLEFAARGMHTLAIDGPGQGISLRLRGLASRHDYEVPGAAAYEYVAARPDVGRARVVAMGYSFGGYYAARIAAFERRYAAAVAFAALHWGLAGWQREIKRRHDIDPKTTAQSTFHFPWVMGCPVSIFGHCLSGSCRACLASESRLR